MYGQNKVHRILYEAKRVGGKLSSGPSGKSHIFNRQLRKSSL